MPSDTAFAPESISAESALVSPVWSILSKGLTGSGKTIFSNGKEFRPCYNFMFEGRFESVLSYYKKRDGHVKDIYYNNFPLGDSSAFFKFDKKMDAIVARPEYKTIVVSSLTSFIRLVLLHLQRSSQGKREEGTNKMKGVRMKGGIQANILEDYNFEDSAIFDLIGFFQTCKDMGMNVILEAHITPYDIKYIDEDTGQKETSTVMEVLTKGKKAPAEIPSWFNEVWLFQKVVQGAWDTTNAQAKYIINTQGDAVNSCKTSFSIPSFEWTNTDPTIQLMKFLNPDIANAPRVDPNKPQTASW